MPSLRGWRSSKATDFIKETGAQEIYLSDGYVDAFAAELRGLGLRLFPLVPPVQLKLL
ncbi:MAG: hypothetical protein IT384_32380 [Deltaproteobacteria bacterium]|nr:hypothetical protein [Deltaproteobacteria bacterium]